MTPNLDVAAHQTLLNLLTTALDDMWGTTNEPAVPMPKNLSFADFDPSHEQALGVVQQKTAQCTQD